ncbi:hypothetical protein A2765_01115 [Candidatus Kaiserbacteria bacterium RIFCSPHIGHO2_01_FULL_56_24]|uniref:DUF5666 domain-containing protein n=1 Tax=Candidatus Kaiserbacteria bacterium RIFCSPHIGHO2_01_FULL_56_24 TaxID=1798487 RepID=A0A1F6DGI9_9BACT|nr:MAG: hypothetical protein A2765_01115 [Candidatus Kaiserbacteria bacterium RIFCSPHIGHO2_01_FULL_56_24]
MKSLVTTLLAIGMISPFVTYAAVDSGFDNYVQHIKEAAEAGNGIVVETHSSASSGGQTASAGQAVTDGDVSASSHVETNINSNNGGGSVQVHVETSQNGKTETKDYQTTIKPGEPVKVNVSAHADSEGSEVVTKVNGESAVSENGDVASSSDEEVGAASINNVEVGAESGFEKALMMVPNFFKKIFSFFWGW